MGSINVKVEVTGLDTIRNNINNLPINFLKNFEFVAQQITEYMFEELKNNMDLTDHTLQELAKMGYPYGTGEHSNISTQEVMRKEKLTTQPLPHTDPLIHTQGTKNSNNLLEHVKKYCEVTENRAIMAAYVLEKDVPYIKFLVHGTVNMIPRPVFMFTWNKIRDSVLQKVEKYIVETLGKTKA